MATGDTLSVVNRALLAIGSQSQISSFTEGSPQANAAAMLFQPTFEQLARAAPWNCLRNQATLTLLAAAQGTPENVSGTTLPLAPVPWLYQYQQPADCLQVRFIVPSLPAATGDVPLFSVNTGAPTWLPRQGQIPYAVAYAADSNGNPENVILTNQDNAIAVYTVNQPNPQYWDSLFQQAMVAALAVYFVPALSLHMPLMQVQRDVADKLIEQARIRDGNEGVVTQDNTPDWIRARSGAAGTYARGGFYGFGAWSDMCWPNY